ncbi:MAG: RNA polymerase sigma factor [Anaerolineae bacterium]
MQWSDEELVGRHLRGDRLAFRKLVDRYTRSIYNLAHRFTADRAEAEDIVQETFLRVYRALPNSRLDLPFRPWLFRIAVNLCRDWTKKRRPAPFSALEVGRDGISPYEEIPDDAPLPLDQIEAEEMKSLLAQAVAELPDPYRLAVTLRYTEGLSYQEIADALDIPLNTVRTHLFRARRLLRQTLEHRLGENP